MDIGEKHLLRSKGRVIEFKFQNVRHPLDEYCTTRIQEPNEVRLSDNLTLFSISFDFLLFIIY